MPIFVELLLGMLMFFTLGLIVGRFIWRRKNI